MTTERSCLNQNSKMEKGLALHSSALLALFLQLLVMTFHSGCLVSVVQRNPISLEHPSVRRTTFASFLNSSGLWGQKNTYRFIVSERRTVLAARR